MMESYDQSKDKEREHFTKKEREIYDGWIRFIKKHNREPKLKELSDFMEVNFKNLKSLYYKKFFHTKMKSIMEVALEKYGVTPDSVAEKIKEGLNAKRQYVGYDKKKGRVVAEETNLPDHGTIKAYGDMFLKIGNHYAPEKKELVITEKIEEVRNTIKEILEVKPEVSELEEAEIVTDTKKTIEDVILEDDRIPESETERQEETNSSEETKGT